MYNFHQLQNVPTINLKFEAIKGEPPCTILVLYLFASILQIKYWFPPVSPFRFSGGTSAWFVGTLFSVKPIRSGNSE